MKKYYYVGNGSAVVLISSKENLERISKGITELVRVDIFGYWLYKLGFCKLALEFRM